VTIAAILLAAETAPGPGGAAALMPWGQETLVEYQIGQLREAGVDVIEVVLGAQAEGIIPLVAADNVEPVLAPARASGPAGALRTGAAAVPREAAAVIVMDVQEPHPAPALRRLLAVHAETGAAVTRPASGGRPGTPLIVSPAVLAELRNISDDEAGIEAVLARYADATTTVAPGPAAEPGMSGAGGA
jgi:CTP:molybdopterin cytidylyltransferase MocA